MSLEQKIEALTAAIEANTAALKAAGGTTAKTEKVEKAEKPEKTTTTKKGANKPAHSVEEAQAVLLKIKDDFGIDNAREVLKAHGIAKMAEIPADKADAVFADATAKYEELSAGGSSDDEGDGGL